jgi:hypothetical protein
MPSKYTFTIPLEIGVLAKVNVTLLLLIDPDGVSPEIGVSALNEVPLPFTIPTTDVESVSVGVVPPELVPAKPLLDATEIDVTPVPEGVEQMALPLAPTPVAY